MRNVYVCWQYDFSRLARRCSWISHQISIVVYIEFAWNYAGFNWNYYYFMRIRSRKSTHISMISNSGTHLQSYTNTAIADITKNSVPILLVTPHDRRANVSASSADIVAMNDECFMMFHNVLRVFYNVLLVVHDVLLVVHDISQCFTCVSWCFTMFYDVYRVSQQSASPHRRPCGRRSRQRRRDRQWRSRPVWKLSSRNRVTPVSIHDPCGVIVDFCGVIADFCGVIADPCGPAELPRSLRRSSGTRGHRCGDADRCATH